MKNENFPLTKSYFKIYYSPTYKLYDFSVFDIDTDKLIHHYHYPNLKEINKLIQKYKSK